jgi:hypothetical protein
MQTYNIVCNDPDHASRSKEVDWSAVLGTVTLPDGVDPTSKVNGYICGACSRAHQENIETIKEAMIDEVQQRLNLAISTTYSSSQQQTLSVLYSDAIATAKTNRKNYLQPSIDWLQTLLTAYAAYKTAVLSAQTKEEAAMVTFDIDNLSPPNVSVTGAMLIPD